MDKLDKQIREIKIARSPEAFLDDIFMNLSEFIISKNYLNIIFYKKDDELLFEYNLKKEYFYYHYDKIYLFLKEKYHCNDMKINKLIMDKIEKYLSIMINSKYGLKKSNFKWIEKHAKLKVKIN